MSHRRWLRRWLLAMAFAAPTIAGAQPASPTVPPPRDNLLAVPLPRLDDLEAAVADQLHDHQQRVVSAAHGSTRDLAEAYGALARVYHAYEFLDSAEPAYVNARRLASGNSEWAHLLGVLYKQSGRLEDAAEALTAARRLQPRDYAAAIYLGEIYMGLNRLSDAREQFQSVTDNLPAVARRGLGDVAMRERRFAEAVEHYRAVLQRVPQAGAVHYSLAMAYRGLGRMDAAREHLERRGAGEVFVGDPAVEALQAVVRGERAWVMQGRRAYDAGQFQAAAEAFTKALAAAPSSVTARVNLGLALVQLGRDADAVGHLGEAKRLSPQEPGLTEALVGALVRLGRADEAIETFSNALSYRPEDEGSVVAMAILLADRQRFRDAIRLLDESNQRFPSRTPTATTLARLLSSSPDVGLRNGQRALELAMAVHNAEPSPAHAETIALALAELGRCGDALEWMKRAIAAAQGNKNAAETQRLSGEISRYQQAICRP